MNNAEIKAAAAMIVSLKAAHCDVNHFHAEALVKDAIDRGFTIDTLADAVAIRINEIPDHWDRRIDRSVYEWAANRYIDIGRKWNLNFESMHSIYINALAKYLMKAISA